MFRQALRKTLTAMTKREAMRLVLHIGTEKTGTTALQTWMQKNAAALRAQGVWPCTSLQTPNNFALAVYGSGLDAGADLLEPLGLHTPGDLDRFRQSVAVNLAQELAAAKDAKCHTFLISSEHLHSRITRQDHVTAIAKLLGTHGVDVSCLLFLRPQADLSRSVQSNHLTWGVRVSDDTFVETAKGHNYDYLNLVSLWTEGLGQPPQVVPYKRHPNTVAWLVTTLGLDRTTLSDLDHREKERVSLQGAAMLNSLADLLPFGPAALLLRQEIVHRTRGLGELTFSRSAAQHIMHAYSDDNRALCDRVDSLQPDDLMPDWDTYPETGSISKTHDLNCEEALRAMMQM